MTGKSDSRRSFLWVGAAAGTGVLAAALGGCVSGGERKGEREEKGKGKEEEEVSPAEDLMREHGVLKRVLLVYGEAIRRIDAKEDLPPEPVMDAARIVRSFVEDYHEKLEEDYLFPRFRKANTLVDLVDVLTRQHQGGRRLTDVTMRYANADSLKNGDDRGRLRDSLAQFIRMYNPHEAREDTVLFPAFRKIVSGHEYDSLGEEFENKEHQLFGDDGSRRWWTAWRGLRRRWGFTTWHSSPHECDPLARRG